MERLPECVVVAVSAVGRKISGVFRTCGDTYNLNTSPLIQSTSRMQSDTYLSFSEASKRESLGANPIEELTPCEL